MEWFLSSDVELLTEDSDFVFLQSMIKRLPLSENKSEKNEYKKFTQAEELERKGKHQLEREEKHQFEKVQEELERNVFPILRRKLDFNSRPYIESLWDRKWRINLLEDKKKIAQLCDWIKYTIQRNLQKAQTQLPINTFLFLEPLLIRISSLFQKEGEIWQRAWIAFFWDSENQKICDWTPYLFGLDNKLFTQMLSSLFGQTMHISCFELFSDFSITKMQSLLQYVQYIQNTHSPVKESIMFTKMMNHLSESLNKMRTQEMRKISRSITQTSI